jgi:hypothetical protein
MIQTDISTKKYFNNIDTPAKNKKKETNYQYTGNFFTANKVNIL